MSEKENATKIDNSLGTNHLAVCCDVGKLLNLCFGLVTPGCLVKKFSITDLSNLKCI